jgi:hypothetical protein
VADKPLIGKWLKAAIKEEVKLIKASSGINLGCVIGPISADIHLHYVIDLCIGSTLQLEI